MAARAKTKPKKCSSSRSRQPKCKQVYTPDEEYHECLKDIKRQLGSGLSDSLQKVISIPHDDPDVTKALQSGGHQLRLIAIWEGCKEYDKEQYYYDPQFSNLLSLLYFFKSEHKKAKNEYDDLAVRIPAACKSIMSLLHKSQYHKCRCEYQEAVVVLKDVLAILRNHNQAGEAKKFFEAELANLCTQVGPSFNQKAVILYTDVLQWVLSQGLNPSPLNVTIHSVFDKQSLFDTWSSFSNESPMKKKLILWAYQVASVMSKLLGKPHLHVLHKLVPDNSELDLEIYFKNILNLLDFVCMTNDEVFAGRAKAETGLAHNMYELIGRRHDRTHMENLPADYVDQCMNQAFEMSPKNPNVLWLVGRYFRQRASDLDGLKQAADVLQRCADICPSLHMALHHLALTHKAMWLIQGNFEEAKLFINTTRCNQGIQGRTKRKQKCQRKREQGERKGIKTYEELRKGAGPVNSLSEADGDCPSTSQEQPSESSLGPVPCTPHDQASGMSHDPLNTTEKKVLSYSRSFPGDLEQPTKRATYKRQASTPASFSKVSSVLARYPVDGMKCPKYYKRPDHFDVLRTNNPKGHEDDVNLRKAQDWLERAIAITKESSPRYLIDLARVLISMKGSQSLNEPDPVDLLKKAEDVIEGRRSDFSNDAAYLYEQWGLLKMNASKFDDAKIMFRKSLQYSVQAKQRSRVAFYKLCDILNKQTRETVDTVQRVSLIKEHALINKMIEQYGAARDIIKKELKQHTQDPSCPALQIREEEFIRRALGRIENGQQLVWELIDAFYKENEMESAFQYLLMIIPFYCAEDLCFEKKVEEVREIACNIAVESVINNNHRRGAGFENVFRWLFPSADELSDSTDDDGDSDDGDDDGDAEISPEPNDVEKKTTEDVAGISDSVDSMAISEVSCNEPCNCGVESCENCILNIDEDYDYVFDDLDILMMTSHENDREINEIVHALSNSFGLKVILMTNEGINEIPEPGATAIEHFEILEEHMHTVRTMFVDIDALPRKSESNNLVFALNNMIEKVPDFRMGFSRTGQSTADHYLLKTFPGVSIDSRMSPVNKAAQLIRTLKLSESGPSDTAEEN